MVKNSLDSKVPSFEVRVPEYFINMGIGPEEIELIRKDLIGKILNSRGDGAVEVAGVMLPETFVRQKIRGLEENDKESLEFVAQVVQRTLSR